LTSAKNDNSNKSLAINPLADNDQHFDGLAAVCICASSRITGQTMRFSLERGQRWMLHNGPTKVTQ
jgi:hypothetical protein